MNRKGGRGGEKGREHLTVSFSHVTWLPPTRGRKKEKSWGGKREKRGG